jgi:DNA-binding GntR family transcriptional regulator
MPSTRKPGDRPAGRPKRSAPARVSPDAVSVADAPHGSRPEQVYFRLRDLIVQGLVAPGSRIIETEIASRLNVSRTPVREALQRLQQEGFVSSAPGAQQSRLTVTPLTRADVQELLGIVGALEGLGAFIAARQEELKRKALARELRAANAEFQRAGRGNSADHSRLYDTDERFHRGIIEASGGPRLLALHTAIKPQAERYIRMYISLLTTDLEVSVAEHTAIIDAIENGKAEAAREAAETNWRHAADRLTRVISIAGERGSW